MVEQWVENEVDLNGSYAAGHAEYDKQVEEIAKAIASPLGDVVGSLTTNLLKPRIKAKAHLFDFFTPVKEFGDSAFSKLTPASDNARILAGKEPLEWVKDHVDLEFVGFGGFFNSPQFEGIKGFVTDEAKKFRGPDLTAIREMSSEIDWKKVPLGNIVIRDTFDFDILGVSGSGTAELGLYNITIDTINNFDNNHEIRGLIDIPVFESEFFGPQGSRGSFGTGGAIINGEQREAKVEFNLNLRY